ncbi:MAG: hypothetical protein JSR59_20505 [Proteobacteria bacterium]|nr:hypothetical protein [Pseudomonadota bacterium]
MQPSQPERSSARAQLDRCLLDAASAAARAEGIPRDVVECACRQPGALSALQELMASVARLRTRGVADAAIADALSGPRFRQALYLLERGTGAA